MRSRFPVAVHLFFLRGDQVLLSRRFNTGYEDGSYSVVAGHVEAGESVIQAAIREAHEEVGVTLAQHDMQVVHVMSRKSTDERVDFFLIVKTWSGEITNREPQKCDELAWFPLSSLPDQLIPYVRHAIEQTLVGNVFSEFGWSR